MPEFFLILVILLCIVYFWGVWPGIYFALGYWIGSYVIGDKTGGVNADAAENVINLYQDNLNQLDTSISDKNKIFDMAESLYKSFGDDIKRKKNITVLSLFSGESQTELYIIGYLKMAHELDITNYFSFDSIMPSANKLSYILNTCEAMGVKYDHSTDVVQLNNKLKTNIPDFLITIRPQISSVVGDTIPKFCQSRKNMYILYKYLDHIIKLYKDKPILGADSVLADVSIKISSVGNYIESTLNVSTNLETTWNELAGRCSDFPDTFDVVDINFT